MIPINSHPNVFKDEDQKDSSPWLIFVHYSKIGIIYLQARPSNVNLEQDSSPSKNIDTIDRNDVKKICKSQSLRTATSFRHQPQGVSDYISHSKFLK